MANKQYDGDKEQYWRGVLRRQAGSGLSVGRILSGRRAEPTLVLRLAANY